MSRMDLGVRITGDAQPLNSELQRTASSIRGVMTNIAGAFGVGISAAAFVGSVRGAMRFAEALRDTSTQMEISTTKLQALYEAGMRYSAGNREIDSGMQRLLASRAQAIDGNERMAEAFARLGISMEDLPFMSTDQLVEKIGRSLVGTTSASNEYGAALDLLGRRAGALIPMLRAIGEDGLDPFQNSLRHMTEDQIAAWDRMAKAAERGSQRIRGILSKAFEGIEWMIPGTGDADFDERVEERVEELMARAQEAGVRRPRAIFRDVARRQLRAEDKTEAEAQRADAEQEMRSARERERLDQDEHARREEMAQLLKESSDLEEQARLARLTDAERLFEVETQIADLIRKQGEEQDSLESARLARRQSELQLVQQSLRQRLDRDAERESERAARETQQRERARADLERIQSGRGVSVGAPVAADQLATIGGYVGAQTNLHQSTMERQLRVMEQMRDYLQRISTKEQGGLVTP